MLSNIIEYCFRIQDYKYENEISRYSKWCFCEYEYVYLPSLIKICKSIYDSDKRLTIVTDETLEVKIIAHFFLVINWTLQNYYNF